MTLKQVQAIQSYGVAYTLHDKRPDGTVCVVFETPVYFIGCRLSNPTIELIAPNVRALWFSTDGTTYLQPPTN